ncbi:hypothetical protein ACOMHN_000625 [Nucella lapillus]
MKPSLLLCSVWFAVVKATDEGAEICSKGPFNFQGSNYGWNTTDTGWKTNHFFENRYMAASFNSDKDTRATHSLESPILCSDINATYQLSFRYYVGNRLFTSKSTCFLAVYLRTQEIQTLLWRSSGSTAFFFDKLSPPFRFLPCSSDFQASLFEECVRTKVDKRNCGWMFNEVSFDDVKYTQVADRSDQKLPCAGVSPEPIIIDDRPAGLSQWTVIGIVVALGIAVLILTVLLIVVAVGRRRRQKQRINDKTTAVGYQTFEGRQSGTSDYETMEGSERLVKIQVQPSGVNNPYNRLQVTGGAAAMEEDAQHSHYDHFDGDGVYSNLDQQGRARLAQRQLMAANYHHID